MKVSIASFVSILLSVSCFGQYNMQPQEALINSTVRQNVYGREDGVIKSYSGTGFLFQFTVAGQNVPVLVTNRHVVKGMIGGEMYFHTPYDKTKFEYENNKMISFGNFRDRWIFHSDPNVDLAILPIQEIIERFRVLGVKVYTPFLNESNIPAASDQWKICNEGKI